MFLKQTKEEHEMFAIIFVFLEDSKAERIPVDGAAGCKFNNDLFDLFISRIKKLWGEKVEFPFYEINWI